MSDIYIRSRKQRYEIARLMTEGMSLQDAEDIVMEGDKNRSRQVRNWKEKGLYPFGSTDKPDSIDSVPEITQEVSTRSYAPRHVVSPVIDEEALLERLLDRLDDATLMKITAARQGIDLSELENMKPRLKKTGRGYPASFRFHEELIARVKAQLAKEGGKETLTGLIERLLFQYIGEPADLLDEDNFLQHKIKLFLGRLDKKRGK